MATIGYGAMYPRTPYANILVTIEAFIGLFGVSTWGALMFAKFSRPTARIMFSDAAVIHQRDGAPTLMFRLANERRNQVVEAHVTVVFIRNETTLEGESFRRIHDLKLVRNSSPVFSLTWTVMHPITEESPLHGATPEDLRRSNAEIIAVVTGVDDTFAQSIHSRHGYTADEIRWGYRFADMLQTGADGRRVLEYAKFHLIEPVSAKPAPAAG
ncbi:MAG: Inward rectifier potassium channel Kirbac3.1 [Myxococcota bacterium]|nr:Inward rectifier potassium channel Kirbac3.1 [Myxococcota bacterium]